MITLAVLDMAGTTVSDDGVVESAFAEALGAMGFDPGGPDLARRLAYVRATMGQSKLEVFTSVFQGDETKAHEASGRFEGAIDAAISRGDVTALPGAEAAFGALRAMGIRICLTTGFSRSTRERIIDLLGWRDLIDLSLSPEPGIRGRPSPDLILTALMRLDVEGVGSIAVAGDTESDIVSGHRAGARVVAGVLTGAHDRSRLSKLSPTHILASIDELPGVIGAGDAWSEGC